MIDKPLPNLETWVDCLSRQDLPVLKRTVRELAALREKEDTVTSRAIAGVVLQDPLMTVKVLALIESRRRASQNHDITTIDHAIMMMGISPFFRHFESLVTIEDTLKAHSQALLGVMKVITRARNASRWARDWAIVRHDLDVDEVTVAALLYDCAEILCWVFAPTLSISLRATLLANPGMRSVAAQVTVFGITAHDLQIGLARAWHLPALLVSLMDDANANHPRVRNVVLAVNLARHAANGWDDPALPDDFAGISSLLHISREALLARLGLTQLEVASSLVSRDD